MSAVLRTYIRATVRSAPATRSGTNPNSGPWSFTSVEILDDDFNKLTAQFGDNVSQDLAVGQTYQLVCDVSTNKYGLNAVIRQHSPLSPAKA